MTGPMGVGLLIAALALQTLVGQVWIDAHLYLPLLLVPVALYGGSVSQRSGMIVGCIAGLLWDAWFQVGAFGATGFRWTLMGWMLGGASHRVDLGHPPGRFFAGAALAVGDRILEVGLRRLLDMPPSDGGLFPLLIRTVSAGLLVALCGIMVDRMRERRGVRHWA